MLLCGVLLYAANAFPQARYWPELNKETRPWCRWWWMGNAVDEKNVDALLKNYHDAGFGGVEIAPIYGAKGFEPRYLPHLSQRWTDMLRFTVDKAAALGMGVDLTNGTGWPFGGPQVDTMSAATRIYSRHFSLSGGSSLKEKINVPDAKGPVRLQALLAVSKDGRKLQLADRVSNDAILNWQAPAGSWDLYATFSGRTGQKVKRAAPGGEGFTLDHFSSGALDRYLAPYDKAFAAKMPALRAFYNDSYEVYGADWTDSFFEEFNKRRGYDLKEHLNDFLSDGDNDNVARIKSDYRETMAELVRENFTKHWTDWAHGRKALTRNQAHGSPGNLLDLYATVDIPEGETFGSSHFDIPGIRRDSADIRNVDPDPVMLRFASSAAHVSGHRYASNETFTWLSEHFKTSLSQTKPEVENVFLAGINHVFYHGVTYSPADVAWPGWLFYASVNFVPSNSWWTHLPALNQYITRVQSVLQSGKPDNELLVYWNVYDVWSKTKGRDMPLKVHDIDEWLHPSTFYKNVKALEQAGYGADFISDAQLSSSAAKASSIITHPAAAPYKALVIPASERMPLATLQHIVRLIKGGAVVIFEALPKDVPGLGELEERRQKFQALLQEIQQLAAKDQASVSINPDVLNDLSKRHISGEQLIGSGLQFIRRQAADGSRYYYIVNHTARDIDQRLALNALGDKALILDPQTGQAGMASASMDQGRLHVRLQIKSGESMIIKVSKSGEQLPSWPYIGKSLPAVSLKGPWRLSFISGGPTLPKERVLKTLQNWTDLGDEEANNFSGVAAYTTSFNMPSTGVKDYLLQISGLHESARIWINGKEASVLWAVPFSCRIGKFLKPGKNIIKIEVANLMANRIRYMDRAGIQWRNYHEINFVNINYKNFDASSWKVMPSGISGSVTITPFQ